MNPAARVSSSVDAGGVRWILQTPTGRWEAFTQGRGVQLDITGEALVTAALLPVMRMGLDLEVEAPVSARFLAGVDKLGDIYHAWHADELRKPALKTRAVITRNQASGARVGMFFTAGLDSFYTLLKHQHEVTDLIYVHGLGGQPESPAMEPRKSAMVHQAAQMLGKNVIEVETGIRPFLTDHGLSWLHIALAPALIALGHTLHTQFKRIYLAATHYYAELHPYGTSPMTDPLWSTEALEIIHDGCEASRIDKARLLVTSEAAMRSLRVCDQVSPNAPNCGRCEKCLRTMMQLLLAGGLDRCTTFAEPIDTELVRRVRLKTPGFTQYYHDILVALEKSGQHREVTRAVRAVVVRARRRFQARALKNALGPRSAAILRALSKLAWRDPARGWS